MQASGICGRLEQYIYPEDVYSSMYTWKLI